MAGPLLALFLLLLLLLPLALSDPPAVDTDAKSLLALKASLVLPDPDPLADWSASAPKPPCHRTAGASWPNILCNRGSVFGLRLTALNLSGPFNVDALRSLHGLRSISIINNHFSGPIPDFPSLRGLKSIYISNNHFSGDIPDDYFLGLKNNLKKLWIDGNDFTGPVPTSLSKVSGLVDLHIENNKFTGALPDIDLPLLSDFNASNNDLTGPIPFHLAKKFNFTAFGGNPKLCGPPLDAECGDKEKGIKTTIILLIAAMISAGLVIGIIIMAKNNTLEPDMEAMDAVASVEASQKQRWAGSWSNRGSIKKGGDEARSDLVMVNEEKGIFGLVNLMKAPAEVLGNGGLGSAYKAVIGSGLAVAVKRMRELNRVPKEAFDLEMRKYGRLRHRNVLPPLAYLYRREEKLVVSEYVRKGSLHFVLHGK